MESLTVERWSTAGLADGLRASRRTDTLSSVRAAQSWEEACVKTAAFTCSQVSHVELRGRMLRVVLRDWQRLGFPETPRKDSCRMAMGRHRTAPGLHMPADTCSGQHQLSQTARRIDIGATVNHRMMSCWGPLCGQAGGTMTPVWLPRYIHWSITEMNPREPASAASVHAWGAGGSAEEL